MEQGTKNGVFGVLLSPHFLRGQNAKTPSFALCSTETLATQATLRPENDPIIPQSCSLKTEEMIESRTLLRRCTHVFYSVAMKMVKNYEVR